MSLSKSSRMMGLEDNYEPDARNPNNMAAPGAGYMSGARRVRVRYMVSAIFPMRRDFFFFCTSVKD